MKVHITVGGKELELSVEELHELREQLDRLCPNPAFYYPYYPVWPVYPYQPYPIITFSASSSHEIDLR